MTSLQVHSCLLAFGFALAASTLLAVRAGRVGYALGLVDHPDGDRKHHRQPTPLMGGVTLLLGVLPGVAILSVMTFGIYAWAGQVLIIATAVMATLGIIDDRHRLGAWLRLVVSFVVFLAAISAAPLYSVQRIVFDESNFAIQLDRVWISDLFSALCCVGLVNAVNLADGKNGLVLGLLIGWTGLLGIASGGPFVLAGLLLLAGLLPLFAANMRGRLFLGDGGTYGFATAIALIAIANYNLSDPGFGRGMSAEFLVLLFAVPAIDFIRLAVVRTLDGRGPMSPDRDHFHHHLQESLGWPVGLFVYWAIDLVPTAMVVAFGAPILVMLAFKVTLYVLAMLHVFGRQSGKST